MVELKKIGPYLNFIKGKAPSTTFEEYKDGLKPYLSPEYLRGVSQPLYVSPNGKLVKVEDGEIIVLWDGSNAGEIFTSKDGVLASTMTKVSVDETEFDRKYFIYSMQYLEYILKAKTAGSGIPHVDKGILKNLEVYKPDISEQRKIASILTKVDDAIQAVKNTIEKAERLKKSLMQNLLTGKLKPDGSWRTEDEFYFDEKFGKVPVGWEVKRIEILIDRKNIQFDPLKNEPINYVGLEHIVPNEFRRDAIGKSNETVSLKLLFSKGDLLFGKLRPYLNKVWLADTDGVCSTDFIVFHKGANTLWCYFNFQTKRFLNFTQSITAGTQHPRASYRDIKKYLIALPIDVLEKTEIERKIFSLENIKEIKKAKIQKLERLKKALMQNLLTGKVRVKV